MLQQYSILPPRSNLPLVCILHSNSGNSHVHVALRPSLVATHTDLPARLFQQQRGGLPSTSVAAKRSRTAQPTEEPEAVQGSGATPEPATRTGSKPGRGRPRKSKAPSEVPVLSEGGASGTATSGQAQPVPPSTSEPAVAEPSPAEPSPAKPHRQRRGSSKSKLKDEAELEIDLTGAQESGVRPPAPSPPQESYAQAQPSAEDALSSSRQQGSQPPLASFAPEEQMDASLPQQQEQEEFRTPGLDSSTADLVARLANSAGTPMPPLARQSQGGAEVDSSRWASWTREAEPEAGEAGVQEGGPLTDPSYAERMGGLPDMGWEKTALRESLGGIDLYRRMRTDINEAALLPGSYILPHDATARERAFMEFSLIKEYWYKRNMEREEVHEAAYAAHDASRARVSNVYANTRRVAGLMTAFEDDDYKLQEASPANIAPWARAELVFSQEFEDFNDYILNNADRLVKEMPKEAEEEELDIVDEALFLLRTEDDDKAAARTSQQQADQDLMDKYLEGVLPGATLDSLATTYAKEIYESDDFDIDVDDDKAGASVDDAE